MQQEFTTESGLSATIDVPEPRAEPPIFVVAGHKTGSVLLTRIVEDIARATGLPAIPVEAQVWREGFSVKDWPDALYALLERPGFVFYSFRWLQKLPEVAAFETARKIFMIRDPRDIAVSYYFSMAKSHGVPKSGNTREMLLKLREDTGRMDIDAFVQAGKAGPVLRNIERFAPFHDRADSIFYRYEDVIFEKRDWVARIARDLDVDLPRETAHEIADRHDILPEKEDPSKHIRSVRPGGWREKLSAESVRHIETAHPAFFERLGYRREA